MDIFSKNLFWDVDATDLDAKEHRRFIIERVLTRGFNERLVGTYTPL